MIWAGEEMKNLSSCAAFMELTMITVAETCGGKNATEETDKH